MHMFQTIFYVQHFSYLQWIDAFREAYSSNHLSTELQSNHDLDMKTFEKPQTCDVCFTLLKGLFYQVKNHTIFAKINYFTKDYIIF